MALSIGDSKIVAATETHIATLKDITEATYAPYVRRIGKRPAPMDAAFPQHISRQDVYVSVLGDVVEGFIITFARHDDQFIENIAVRPQSQGAGVGKRLMEFAMSLARQNGKRYVRLYTNEKMTESLTVYLKIGFIETERRLEDGFQRVFMEMRIAS